MGDNQPANMGERESEKESCACVRESERLHDKLLCAAAQQQAMREKERPSVGKREILQRRDKEEVQAWERERKLFWHVRRGCFGA